MRAFDRFDELDQQSLPQGTQVNSLLAIATVLAMLGLGVVIRNNTLAATTVYEDRINGVTAQLPANWLIDAEPEDQTYIFRATDTGGIPFKTYIQVSIVTVGADANPRNVIDALNVLGPARLSIYHVVSIEETRLGDDVATRITYFYVDTEENPFLETEPTVVEGVDLVVIRRNQALIFTFRDAAATFEENEFYFRNFLETVEY
ncbi:MAG: hypothetical protein GYB66_01800 [Chloroflexi bacterium]|nr:hypothetical protein [Chloroflexota bacterium]